MFFPGFLFISTHISLNLLSLGSAETYIHWVRWETEWSFDDRFRREYSYQKLSKSDNRFSNYSQKCRGCFF